MLDSKYLRHHLDETVRRLRERGFVFDKDKYLALEFKRKTLQASVEQLQQRMNSTAKQLGALKRSSSDNQDTVQRELLEDSRVTKASLQKDLADFQVLQTELSNFLLQLPNLPDPSTPTGTGERDNQLVRTWGEPSRFSFIPKDHVNLSERLNNGLDFESGATITGSRFVVLHQAFARLQRALTQWMLDVHTQHGYREVAVPYLINAESLRATGQLPLFESDLFRLTAPDQWYLSPTGEVPITNLARDRIFSEAELPMKYVGYTPCFRSEAGSYGKDVRGMIRQHQFDKVELVYFTTPSQAANHLETLTQSAEFILQKLKLPYRVMALCRGDLGFSSCKTYDLEVWLPSQNTFREISSCSHMGDFQARRLKARRRSRSTNQLDYVHTLNGSGLAVGRTLVAILENYQQEDGSICIPEVLKPYMAGITSIKA